MLEKDEFSLNSISLPRINLSKIFQQTGSAHSWPNLFLLSMVPCAPEKSTVVNLLLPRYRRLFRASSDQLKWLISDYAIGKDGKRIAEDLAFNFAEIAIQKGFSVVVDASSVFRQYQRHEDYRSLCLRRAIRFLEINIEAPFAILEERFIARAQDVEHGRRRSAVTDIDHMQHRYDIYMAYRDASLETLDSSVLQPMQMVSAIQEMLHA